MKYSRNIRIMAMATVSCIPFLSVAPIGYISQAQSYEDTTHKKYAFNIPAQNLNKALKAFIQTTGIQHFYSDSAISRIDVKSVIGSYTAGNALNILLSGTKYKMEFSGDNTVVIKSISGGSGNQKNDLPADNGAASESDGNSATILDELVVTATRRSESIQDVPLSVVSFNASLMKKLGVVDVADITAYIPNFEFAAASLQTNLYIRGIGSGTSHSIEQSVGRFVDDVYTGRADMNLGGFMDLAGLDVLRGPQGALFGKNTAAGAVIIRTADPTAEFESGFTAAYGAYSTVNDYKEFEGFMSGPLTDDLRGRLAVRWRDDGGYVENLLPGPDSADRRDIGMRLKLEWDASENTTVRFKAEYNTYHTDGQLFSEINAPSPFSNIDDLFTAIIPTALKLDWQNFLDCEAEPIAQISETESVNTGRWCPFRDQETGTLALTIDHTVEGIGTIRSISAYQSYDWTENFSVVDQGISGTAFRAERAERYNGISQEFRLTSEEFEQYDYIAGVYYEKSEIDRFQRSHFNFFTFFGTPPLFTRNQPWVQDTETIAAYGQFRWHFSQDLDFIVGGRYSHENKRIVWRQFWNEFQTYVPLAGPPTFSRDEKRSESDFSPTFSIKWNPNDDLMLFTTVSRGYKSGGFSDRIESPTVEIGYDPETNWTYEAGVKSTLLDGRLTANATFFYIDIKNMQLAAQVPNEISVFAVVNAAEATSKGIELETNFQATDNLLLGGNFSYTDAKFSEYNGTCPTDTPRVGVAPVNPDGTCNFSGFPLIFAPKYKGTVYGQYTVPEAIADWDLTLRATLSYSSEIFMTVTYNPGAYQSAFAKVDGMIRLTSPDDRYSVSLVGRNLTNKAVLDWALLVGGGPFRSYAASAKPPRDISIRLSANF